ncbi:MAG: acetyl-CoA C-acetyltransferase [Acidobacteria bacterium]|nr:acetyl-CoA C-acetyltransferase [Acidobacteriota bacterium]
MPGSVLVAGARTPIGKLSGALGSLSAADLGGIAIKAALARAGVAPEAVDAVLLGQVILAGAGQMPARQAAVKGGIPHDVPATTVNKACLSGLDTIAWADQLISLGQADIVVAGGMESMTQAPHLMLGGRAGYRAGDVTLHDALFHDGLDCGLEHCSMGLSTERSLAKLGGISREQQDAFSAASHERAAAAAKDGRLADEIEPVSIPQRKGDPVLVETDEGVRPGTTAESLAGLRPAFDADGTITAGNASQISDGGAAVVVMSKAKADALGLTPIAEIVSYGTVAGPDTSLLLQPANATRKALAAAGLALADIDLFEMNEAFAAVVLASMTDLGTPPDIVNVNGGAIAFGHPVGMSGTRLALTIAHELARRGGGTGVAALCGGGGQGEAMVLRSLS